MFFAVSFMNLALGPVFLGRTWEDAAWPFVTSRGRYDCMSRVRFPSPAPTYRCITHRTSHRKRPPRGAITQFKEITVADRLARSHQRPQISRSAVLAAPCSDVGRTRAGGS